MRLVFRRATDSETNEEASDEPESLPNRIHRTLTEYPGTENGKGEHQKSYPVTQ